MQNIINAKNTTVTPALENYIEKKFSKLAKFLNDDTSIYTKIEVKDNGNRHKVEVTIPLGRDVARAEVNNRDMYAAIDEAEDILIRRLRQRKEKNVQRKRGPREMPVEQDVSIEYPITKIKTHELIAMTAQDACEAMELVGHDFYVYQDVDRNNKICLVYEKENGEYGNLIFN